MANSKNYSKKKTVKDSKEETTKKTTVRKSSGTKKVSTKRKTIKDSELEAEVKLPVKKKVVKKKTSKSDTKDKAVDKDKVVNKKETTYKKKTTSKTKSIRGKGKIIEEQQLDNNEVVSDSNKFVEPVYDIDKDKYKDDLIITREIDISELQSYIENESKEADDLADTAIIKLDEIEKKLKELEEKEQEEDNKVVDQYIEMENQFASIEDNDDVEQVDKIEEDTKSIVEISDEVKQEETSNEENKEIDNVEEINTIEEIKNEIEEDNKELKPKRKRETKNDNFDLDENVKRTLKELSVNDQEYSFLLEVGKHTSKKRRRNIKRLKMILLIMLVILFFMVIVLVVKNMLSKNSIIESNTSLFGISFKKEDKGAEYSKCLNEKYNNDDTSEEIENYITDLNSYLVSKYNVSILYLDIERGFSFKYNEGKSYYAASTIKALDALYIYNKAALGEIDLDSTMTYSSGYRWSSSRFMKDYKYGEKVSLRNLVKYAIVGSDNSAHQMLVSYIKKSKLREYGKSLGATLTLNGDDNFGHIDVKDASIYMKELYNFINNNTELGEELKSYFVESDQNDLKIGNIQAACKYGEYEYNYHNIGIVFDEHPYILVILSEEGRKNFEAIISEISVRINELHNMYYNNRKDYCTKKVYE